MRLRQSKLFAAVIFGLLGMSEVALSVEQAEIKIEGRWSVVGVIAGDHSKSNAPTGIAVLRSNVTKRTYTLAIGDSVPNEFGFVLKNVLPHSVVIAKNGENVTLTFADPSSDSSEAPAEQPSRSSRFLDNYYRSFNRSHAQEHPADDEDDDDERSLFLPPVSGLPHVGTKHDEATSVDAPRGRTYHMDDSGDFTVEYDED